MSIFKPSTSGSVVCPSCGRLVGVRDEKCLGCGRAHPGLWGYAPLLNKLGRDLGFTQIVVVTCSVLFVFMLLRNPGQILGGNLLTILSPDRQALFLFGASGAIPVFAAGRWWTVLSAAWLHGGLLHIFFNMMWIRQLAPAVGEFYGVGRLVLIYTASSIGGFALTSVMGLFALPRLLQGADFTVGASAPLFGLFGALLLYGQRTGQSLLTRQIWTWVIVFAVFGLVVPFVDNWAHLGGFIGGWIASRWLNPTKPEMPQHLIAALVCLAATALSIVASILHGVPFIR